MRYCICRCLIILSVYCLLFTLLLISYVCCEENDRKSECKCATLTGEMQTCDVYDYVNCLVPKLGQ